MSYKIPRSLNDEISIKWGITLDFFIVLAGATALSFRVGTIFIHPFLRLPFTLFFIISAFELYKKSKGNHGMRGFQTMIYLAKRKKIPYESVYRLNYKEAKQVVFKKTSKKTKKRKNY